MLRPNVDGGSGRGGQLLRTGLVLIAGLLAFVVTLQVSIAGALRSKAPLSALSVAPFDSDARARLAGALVSVSPSPEARRAAAGLAADSVRRSPANAVAFRALALAADDGTPEGSARALALMNHGQRLSRRDVMTHVWLIQHFLRIGDIDRMMAQLDVALRTSESGRGILFPLATSAASDPRIAASLIERLRDNPSWRQPFAEYLQLPEVEASTAAHIAANLNVAVPQERAAVEGVIRRLASAEEYDLAWQLYEASGFAQAHNPATVRNGQFELPAGIPPFDWVYNQDPDLWAAVGMREDGEGAALQLYAERRSGDLARQLLRMSPGRYRLRAEVGNVPDAPFERPSLSVVCADGAGRVLATLSPASAGSAGQFIGTRFSVPADCRSQWLVVSQSAPAARSAAPAWVDNIASTPLPEADE